MNVRKKRGLSKIMRVSNVVVFFFPEAAITTRSSTLVVSKSWAIIYKLPTHNGRSRGIVHVFFYREGHVVGTCMSRDCHVVETLLHVSSLRFCTFLLQNNASFDRKK